MGLVHLQGKEGTEGEGSPCAHTGERPCEREKAALCKPERVRS